MNKIIDNVIEAIERAGLVQVEVSARHVHLCKQDLERLFGPLATLSPKRELSQPGQFLSQERVTLVGPKGKKENVAILGPIREYTQVELSKTDCAELGIDAPVRESGDIMGSAAITLTGTKGSISIMQGCIVAKNHIHMTPDSAAKLNLKDKQYVSVELLSERSIIFRKVLVRVSDSFRNRMHVDFDEANAGCVKGFVLGQIILTTSSKFSVS